MRRSSLAAIVLFACCSLRVTGIGLADQGESGLGTGSVGAAQAGAPVYPGGKPINGGLMTMTLYSKPTGTSVTFSTNASFDDVYKYYKRALPAKAETSESNGDPNSRIGTFSYVKGDGSKIDIEIRAFPGHVNYTIVHTFKK
jgi:hypothetical protein